MRLRPLPLLALLLLPWAAAHPATPADPKRWDRFQPEFTKFAELDAQRAFPAGGVLFVGSSIFRQWTDVDTALAPLPVLNRAFGGSRTGDQLERFEELAPRYRPALIVYYCGSNDLKAGDKPEDIFARFAEFSRRCQALVPVPRIVFVSSIRSADRVEKWPDVERYNGLVRELCARTSGHRYVEINPVLHDESGEPIARLFRDDRLHLQPAAYARLAAVLRPVIEEELRAARSSP